MKYLLLLALLFLTACTVTEPIAENTSADETSESSMELNDASVDNANEETVSETEIIEEETPQMVDLSQTPFLQLRVSTIELSRPFFNDEQEYELKFFSNTLDDVAAFQLCFTPMCSEKPKEMFISVNDWLLSNQVHPCKEQACVDLSTEHFENGPNTILFQSQVREDYYVEEVSLDFEYKNSTTISFEGENFFLEKFDTSDILFDEVDGINLQNTQTRTFELTAEETRFDITMNLELSKIEGELQIIFNGGEVYKGEPKKEFELTLPQETLIVGTNELVFIGMY